MTIPSPTWPAPPEWRGALLIEPLTRHLADLDTAAYTSSPQAIEQHSAGRWPTDGFTLTENLDLIAGHEAEHHAGTAFAYALLSPARDREVGCVYLRPLAPYCERTGMQLLDAAVDVSATAIATFWLIDDASARPATAAVVAELDSWLAAWGAAPVVFRCLPEEAESSAALRHLGLGAIETAGQELPYRWFRRV